MKLKPWMAIGMAVAAIGMAVVSIQCNNRQTSVTVAQPTEEDFEERVAKAASEHAASPAAGAVAPVPPAPQPGGAQSGALRPGLKTSGQGKTDTAVSVTGVPATSGRSSADATVANASVGNAGQSANAARRNTSLAVSPVPTVAVAGSTGPSTGTSTEQLQTRETPLPPAQLSTTDLWAESTRLKRATGKVEIERRIEVNRELIDRLWVIRRTAEQQSRVAKDRNEYDAAQAQVQSTTKQLNELESSISADTAQINRT